MTDHPLTATLIVIGDEILGGFIRDENVWWLAQRLQHHGVDLQRVVMAPDERDAIGDEIRAALARSRPHLVLTTGGIGSTPDDITYEAVAETLGRDLVVAPEIASRLDQIIMWTANQGFDVDDEFVDHLMRMARIPEGSVPLEEKGGGWVLGVRADVDGGIDAADGATVVVLPGVPSQLRKIVEQVIEPEFLVGRGIDERVTEVTHEFPESALNRCFARLADELPGVKVGSYPGRPMVVRLRGPKSEVDEARTLVETYLRELEQDPGGARLLAAWTDRYGRAVDEEDDSPRRRDRADRDEDV
jgi:molybdenum cofactor synthesis domain-containing protein